MSECTLHNLLTSCQYPQVFWIYQMNDYDENILLTKGTKQEMLEDDENSFDLIDHINDVVEYWTIREDGAMFVRIRMDDRAKELFSEDYVKKMGWVQSVKETLSVHSRIRRFYELHLWFVRISAPIWRPSRLSSLGGA